MSTEEVIVWAWPKPRGYANGRVGVGRVLHVAGQIGWDEHGAFVAGGLVAQFAKALDNVLAVVAAAGGAPTDIASMTVYVTDIEAYRRAGAELGPVWKQRLGRHYPAMALVAVTALVERVAVVEIQATAHLAELAQPAKPADPAEPTKPADAAPPADAEPADAAPPADAEPAEPAEPADAAPPADAESAESAADVDGAAP